MVLITSGTDSVTPQVVLSFTTERESRTNVHPILGRSEPDVTTRPAGSRTGTIELGFHGPSSEGDSALAESLFATGAVFSVLAPERPSLEVTATPGRITRALEEETRDAWIVTVEFTEVGG